MEAIGGFCLYCEHKHRGISQCNYCDCDWDKIQEGNMLKKIWKKIKSWFWIKD